MAAGLAVLVPVAATIIIWAGVRSSLGICAIFIALQASDCSTGRDGEDSSGRYTGTPQFGNCFDPRSPRLYGACADRVRLSGFQPVRAGFTRRATVPRQLRVPGDEIRTAPCGARCRNNKGSRSCNPTSWRLSARGGCAARRPIHATASEEVFI